METLLSSARGSETIVKFIRNRKALADLMKNLKFEIDGEQLQRHIDVLGAIGVDEKKELFRPVYSEAWLAARQQLEQWMLELGLETRLDAAGNLFGRLTGTDQSAPVVLSGSHIDTVRNGGRYDGALGVHAAIAAVKAIQAHGVLPERTIEVVALCEEEGSRFTSPLWGTQAILGRIPAGTPGQLLDSDGVTMADAMRSVGLDPDRLPDAERSDIGNFVELHIEQGGILEADGVALGVVEVITGQRHFKISVSGTQNHAGTTSMDMRFDALSGAAEMILAVERIASDAGRPTVATVGQLSLTPGSRNVIPGRVEFTVDLRNPDVTALDQLTESIREVVSGTAGRRGLSAQVDEVKASAQAPVHMDEQVREAIISACSTLGVRWQPMVSGAGHDSQLFAQHLPTAMIFTPSIGGISHSPKEFTPIEMIVPCVTVLAHTLWSLANPVEAS